MKRTLFIQHASQLVTVAGRNAARAGKAQGKLDLIEDGAIYCVAERIVDVGTTKAVLARHPEAAEASKVITAAGQAVIPGLVDCHAHPVFAGDRSDEYALRLSGKTYREIFAAGGGILKTVRHTRMATAQDLLRSLRQRLNTALACGTTTMEAKSGYGLDEPTERKILRVVRSANTGSKRHPIDLVPTLLFAHCVPQGMTADEMVEASFSATPKLAELAEFVDVFCEEGFFDVAQSKQILEAGKRAGLAVKVHADEMSLLGGAKLAARLDAISADHLLFTDSRSIQAMKRSGTIAVLLPVTPFALQLPYADARRWIAAGVPVAIGTDFSPNAYCLSLPFAFTLAVYGMRMTPAEALIAMTINAAAALRREKLVGSLTRGKLADIVILKGPSYLQLGYHLAGNPVAKVIKRGRLVATNL